MVKGFFGFVWICFLGWAAVTYFNDSFNKSGAKLPVIAQAADQPRAPVFQPAQRPQPQQSQRYPFVDVEYDKFMAPLLRLHRAVLVKPTHAADVESVLDECEAVAKAYESGHSVFSERKYMPEASRKFDNVLAKMAALKSFYSFTLRPMMQQLDTPRRQRTKEDVDQVKRYASLPKSTWDKFGSDFLKYRGDLVAAIGEFGGAVDNDRR